MNGSTTDYELLMRSSGGDIACLDKKSEAVCNGHGECIDGSCQCSSGWQGTTCEVAPAGTCEDVADAGTCSWNCKTKSCERDDTCYEDCVIANDKCTSSGTKTCPTSGWNAGLKFWNLTDPSGTETKRGIPTCQCYSTEGDYCGPTRDLGRRCESGFCGIWSRRNVGTTSDPTCCPVGGEVQHHGGVGAKGNYCTGLGYNDVCQYSSQCTQVITEDEWNKRVKEKGGGHWASGDICRPDGVCGISRAGGKQGYCSDGGPFQWGYAICKPLKS